MIATGFYRNSYGAPLLASLINSNNDPIVPGAIYIDGSDDGQTLTELWRDDTFKGTSSGITDVYGPTVNGYVLANAIGTAKTLRGQIIPGVVGQLDKYFTLTGDGSTTSFTIAHNMSTTPTTLNAYPQNAAAVAQTAPTLSADGTNITLTFASAPANGASLSYALRYK